MIAYDATVHSEACLSLSLAVRASDPAYPPPNVGSTKEDFSKWFADDEYLGRWVAEIDGEVVGHVGLTLPHSYLARVLPSEEGHAEVSRLLVAPTARRAGVGARLLVGAREAAIAAGLIPALSVLASTPGAIELYRAAGWQERGTFMGAQGLNYVFTYDVGMMAFTT